MKFFYKKSWGKKLLTIFFLIVFLFSGNFFYEDVYSDELDDLNKQIQELQSALTSSQNATKPLEGQLTNLKKQLDNIDFQVGLIELDIAKRKIEIEKGYENLSENQEIFNFTVRNSYINSYGFTPLIIFLSGEDAGDVTKLLTYHERYTKRDKETITNIALQIVDLEGRKVRLENEQTRLASAMKTLDTQRAEVQKVVDGAKEYQADLTGKIATLTSRQQELLAQKFNSAPVPKLAVTSLSGCSSDIGKSPGFGDAIGFFSFGVPNKVGLNQYGARARAESGQSYETILNAYYTNINIGDYSTDINITVNGTNEYGQTFDNESMNIEEYLKHLYEMPSGWDSKALQAQAIAARSYALARTNNGSSPIPPNQSGQVVKKELNAQSWVDAVEATRGKVMLSGGNPISAWYSSTHGGVVLKSGEIGWNDTAFTKHAIDTPSGSASSFSDLHSSSYDKSSPWFYCDWGHRSSYNNTAWLKNEEVADIVNAYILWDLDHNLITHLSQADQPTPDTWSFDKVKEEISNRGGSPTSSISSISVGWDGSGISRTVTINGRSFDAQKFKNMFNLRAPANIQIKPACQPDSNLNCGSMYALYNVERM